MIYNKFDDRSGQIKSGSYYVVLTTNTDHEQNRRRRTNGILEFGI